MNKSEALAKFGKEVVDKARDMYETSGDKVLFEEDVTSEHEEPLNSEERLDYLHRAKSYLQPALVGRSH